MKTEYIGPARLLGKGAGRPHWQCRPHNMVSEDVRWEAGQQVAVFRGGHNAVTGQQSVITINSIIGTRGVPGINPFDLRPSLTNSKLFARDRNVCAYCGNHFHESDLTREHIIPQALGAPRPLMGAA